MLIEDKLSFPLFPKMGYVVDNSFSRTNRVFGFTRREPVSAEETRSVPDDWVFTRLEAQILGF